MRLTTELCRQLGVELPIFCAGMGGAAGPELVAAVSNAGGLGVLGAAGAAPDDLRRKIGSLHELTARPFGVNFIIDGVESEEDVNFIREEVLTAASEGAVAVVVFWGDPAPYVETAHQAGAKLLIQVGSVQEALSAADAGVDAIIAQGVEAGGHVRGTTSTWTLLPQVVQAVDPLPVVASGGMGDGFGAARALALGAQAVSLGTRFLASEEARAHPEYKRRVVASTAADTFYGELFDVWWPDAPHRVLRNRLIEEWEAAGCPPPGQRPGEGTTIGTVVLSSGAKSAWPRYAVGVAGPEFEGYLEYAPLWAGESCTVVKDIKPAATIVRDLAREAEAALAEGSVSPRGAPRGAADP
ncbi:MAG TPA: nitronate monooxygenase [Solirubrobacteraceae bacterium]|nr:nitronate monooxygenase [Solirubrobacteraceae bacterium]